jgi:hypothetical protein
MSELIEEYVSGGCTRALLAMLESYRPPNLANLSLVSWEFRDSSHGEAYRRGSTLVTMGPARDRAKRDTSVYPGSGPSRLEVNPYFLPASY